MDREKVIRKLNAALERELAELVRYLHQSFWPQCRGRAGLAKFFRNQAQESMGHAIRVGEKIVELGGAPLINFLEIFEPKSLSPEEMLRACARSEREALAGYQDLLRLVAPDKKLHTLVSVLAEEESRHVAETEAMALALGRPRSRRLPVLQD